MTTKLTADHSTFIRLREAIDTETKIFRARMLVMLTKQGVLTPHVAADRAARAFCRRFEKQFGLRGKYVAH